MSDEAMPHMSVREGKSAACRPGSSACPSPASAASRSTCRPTTARPSGKRSGPKARSMAPAPTAPRPCTCCAREKGYIIVGQDTDGTVTPGDAGLDWAIGKKKTDFVGIRGLTRPDLVAPGRKQLVGLKTKDPKTVLEEGAQIVANPQPADPDEDDRPRHIELLVGELRPLDRDGSGRRWALALGRDAVRADAARRRSRSKSARRCSSTRRRPPQWLTPSAIRRRPAANSRRRA